MPKVTEKDKIINFLIQNAVDEIEFVEISEHEESCKDELIDKILDDVIDDITVVVPHRRGFSNLVPKSMTWSLNILTQLDDNRFLQMLRINRFEFNVLVSLISQDPEFNKPHSCEQFPKEYQLAIVLYRLGSCGEGSTLKKIASIFGIGDGGTIDKITRRVFKSFLNMQSKYIYWPNEHERASIVSETYSELPFCIGYVDGSEIPLAEAPVINKVSFFSRTQKYSIKAQMVWDFKLRIRHIVVGHPGSVHDSKIFKNCDIYKQPIKYFSAHQWIAGDSAYPLSNNLVTPYRMNSCQMDSKKRKQFNRRHSTYRVRIEHCFGVLKEKFNSLKGLKMRINSFQNLGGIQMPEQMEEYQDDDDPYEQPDEEQIPQAENKKYEIKRQALYSLFFD